MIVAISCSSPRAAPSKEVWQHTEVQGWDFSTVGVLSTGQPHRQDVALIELTMTGQSQALTATRLRLDSSAAKIAASQLPDAGAPLFVVTASGDQRGDDCLAGFQLLDARLFPGVRRRGSFPGMVLATQRQAKERLEQLTACAGAPSGSIYVYRDRAGRGR
jgi:hypothetical protein